MSKSLRLVLSGACFLCGLNLFSGAAQAAQSGVDRSFGEDGVVHIAPLPSPGYTSTSVANLAAAPGGASYALEAGYNACVYSGCAYGFFLVRYDADGSLDPAFNGPSGVPVAVSPTAYQAAVVADGRGRPLVALPGVDGVRLFRFDLGGNLDPGFGNGGEARVSCECSGRIGLVLDSRGRILIESSHGNYEGPSTVFFARLRSDGSLDPRFGRGGREKVSFGPQGPIGFAARASGAVYLWGNGCCGGPKSFYVIRVSRRGRLDNRFNLRARRSLERLRERLQRPGASFAGETLALRPHGRMDLFAHSFKDESYALRLLSSGNPDRGFGHGGARKIALPVDAAAVDDRGGTFVIGYGGYRYGLRIAHLLPSGRPDPSFAGGDSLPLPGQGEEGDVLAPQRGGRVMVLDVGQHACRQYCPPTPTLLRFIARGGGGARR